MAFFELEQIDRGMEWALRDKFIEAGLEVDLRYYLANPDDAAYRAAIKALNPRVEIFGTGAYQDRSQLKTNNVIVDRIDIVPGDIGFNGSFLVTQNDLDPNFTVKKPTDGTYDVLYEVRLYCLTIGLERNALRQILAALGQRRYLDGILDEQLNTTDCQFLVERLGAGVNLSGKNFIEWVYRYAVRDVELDEGEVIDVVSPILEVGIGITPEIDLVDQDPAEWETDEMSAFVKAYELIDSFENVKWLLQPDHISQEYWNEAGKQVNNLANSALGNAQLTSGVLVNIVSQQTDYIRLQQSFTFGGTSLMTWVVTFNRNFASNQVLLGGGIPPSGGGNQVRMNAGQFSVGFSNIFNYNFTGVRHVVITKNGTTWKLYVNGEFVEEDNNSNSANVAVIGSDGGANVGASVREMSYFQNVEKDADWVKDLYNNPNSFIQKSTGALFAFSMNDYRLSDGMFVFNYSSLNHGEVVSSGTNFIQNYVNTGLQSILHGYSMYYHFKYASAQYITLNSFNFGSWGEITFEFKGVILDRDSENTDDDHFLGSGPNANRLQLNINLSKGVNLNVANPTSGIISVASSNSLYAVNKKFDITLSLKIDGTNFNYRVFIDGVTRISGSVSANNLSNFSFIDQTAWYIGRRNTAYFNGLFGEVNIYDQYTSDGVTTNLNKRHQFYGYSWVDQVGSLTATRVGNNNQRLLTVNPDDTIDNLGVAVQYPWKPGQLNFGGGFHGGMVVGNLGNIQSIAFGLWVENASLSQVLIDLGSGGNIQMSGGVISSSAAFDTIEVDNGANVLVAGTFMFITLQGTTDIDADNVTVAAGVNCRMVMPMAFTGAIKDTNELKQIYELYY